MMVREAADELLRKARVSWGALRRRSPADASAQGRTRLDRAAAGDFSAAPPPRGREGGALASSRIAYDDPCDSEEICAYYRDADGRVHILL
jgi:hypothetical protein